MARPTKVLWLTKGLGRGGTERLLLSSASLLDRDKFSVDVAYLIPTEDALAAPLQALGLDVHCLRQANNADLRWIGGLRKLVASRGYDIVHTHMPLPAAFSRMSLGRPRPAFVHTEHNIWHRYHWATYWANALTYHRNDKVIAVSKAVAASIQANHVPRHLPDIEVVYHGISLDDTSTVAEGRDAARQSLGLAPSAFVVGTVGNLTPKKDQRTLIEAVAVLRRTVPAVQLVIIGTGPLEGELRRLVADLGLTRQTSFLGARDDVRQLLPAFDAFALSSRYEGLSIALVEALASGLPVVVTGVGGMPEVVSHDVEGFLVQPGDAVALARALARLATDADLCGRLGANGMRRARSFDINVAHQRIESIYGEVADVHENGRSRTPGVR